MEKQRERSRYRRARHLAAYIGLRAAVFLIRLLPLETASDIVGVACRLLGPLSKQQKLALRHLALAFPALTDAQRQRIAADQWENVGRTAAEGFHRDPLLEPGRVELAVDPMLRKKLTAPGGKVFVSLHSGNWEIVALPLCRNLRFMGLYRDLSNPLVNRFVERTRRQVYAGGLLSREPTTAARVVRWVREGNAVAMLADAREKHGVEVTFFGEPVVASPFPARVASRLGAPLFAARVVRLPRSHFRVEVVEIPVQRTEGRGAEVIAATQAIQSLFERWIRERPGEWLWVQKRWARRGR